MNELELKLDFDRLTLADLILVKTIQHGKAKPIETIIENAEQIRDMVAHLAVSRDGMSIDEAQAREFANRMTVGELVRALNGVAKKVTGMETDAANPLSGSG